MKNVSTMLFLGSSLARPAEDFGDNLLEKISNEINVDSRVYEMDISLNDSASEPVFLLDRPAFKKFLESHQPRERRYSDSSTSEFTWTPGPTVDTTSTQFSTTQTLEGDPTTSTIDDPTTTTTDSANDPDWEPSSTVDTTSTAVPFSTTTTWGRHLPTESTTTTSAPRTIRNWFLEWLDNFGFHW
ncbi:unnamed protein product [Oikopleura dioica]|uniref:Uncharacterized protein n=1 Tax=Oikopleura dioica TaxID=34765 RepID=E4YG57_OIKDI|nr:unnamed protein product [Oikopleura dioica]